MQTLTARAPSAMIGQVALKLTELAIEDLRLVVDLVDRLQRPAEPHQPLSTTEIRELAKHRAALLNEVPREQVAAHFAEIAEEIRQEAMAKGTAIEGDWRDD